MISHPYFTQIIRELEQHQDSLRIKKLLVYTVEHRWESDKSALARLELPSVCQTILQQFSSLEHLQQGLNRAVRNLSRPEAYSRIASVILKIFTPLYQDPYGDAPEGSTQIRTAVVPQTSPSQSQRSAFDSVIHQIEKHPEGIRIKKLLFALCHQRWENDFQLLGKASFDQLLQQVRDLYPSPHDLAVALQSLVASLNRQSLYSQIANSILDFVSPLYRIPDEPTGLTKPTFPPIEIAALEEDISNANYQGFMSLGGKNSKQSSMEQADITEADIAVPLQPKQTYTKESIEVGSSFTTKDPISQSHFADSLDIYQLKLEIMKYANPLRVKILLFSTVHRPFDLSGQDWSMLRTCDFDELLKQTIQESDSTTALEIRLSAIAQSLFESEEHLQATSAIIQSINLLSQSN